MSANGKCHARKEYQSDWEDSGKTLKNEDTNGRSRATKRDQEHVHFRKFRVLEYGAEFEASATFLAREGFRNTNSHQPPPQNTELFYFMAAINHGLCNAKSLMGHFDV